MKLHLSFRRKSESSCAALRFAFTLREAESGCAPDRAVPFLCFAKEKEPKVREAGVRSLGEAKLRARQRRPDGGGRPRADCSAVLGVWGLAPNSLRGLRPLRSDNRAKSVDEARYRSRPQTPALLDASHGAQEQYGRSASPNIPCPISLRIGREQRDAPRVWCLSSPSDELSSAGLCGARVSAHPQLTSGGCLNAVSAANVVSSARPAKPEQRKVALAPRGPRRQGRFLCPLSLSTQRKGVGCRAENPARPHAVNRSDNATAAQSQILDSRLRGNDGAA